MDDSWRLEINGVVFHVPPDVVQYVQTLLREKAEAERRLEANECNAGHRTLPLKLWDCPECVRLRIATLHAQLAAAKCGRRIEIELPDG